MKRLGYFSVFLASCAVIWGDWDAVYAFFAAFFGMRLPTIVALLVVVAMAISISVRERD